MFIEYVLKVKILQFNSDIQFIYLYLNSIFLSFSSVHLAHLRISLIGNNIKKFKNLVFAFFIYKHQSDAKNNQLLIQNEKLPNRYKFI